MTVTSCAERPVWATLALSVRTALTTGALVLLLGLGAISVLTRPPAQPQELGLSARPLDHMMTANRCSYTGFDSSVIPSKAIVRDMSGRNRLVSFDDGWAVFTGKKTGQLVAVCLGPAHTR
ncbi:MAG TPA: hypothetical protein VJ872_11935 [Nocardioides sp.]|nr:hypothetical protein [Nocardioides sp.]